MPAPLFLSWSALKAHEECKQMEHLRRTKHSPPAKDIRNYVHGTIADRVVRTWLLEEMDHKPGQMQALVKDIFEEETHSIAAGGKADGVVKWRGRNDRALTLNLVREICEAAEPFLFEHVIPHDYDYGIRFKQPLTIEYLDGTPIQIWLVGEIDLLVNRGGNDWLGVDLKGTKNEDYWRQTAGQLVYYDLACKPMVGTYCKQWILLQPLLGSKDKQWMRFDVSAEDRRELVRRITKFAHARWKKDYTPKESMKGCSYCDVKHACAKFVNFQVDDNGGKRLPFAVSRTQ